MTVTRPTVGHIVRYSVVASVYMVSCYSTHVTNVNTIIVAHCYKNGTSLYLSTDLMALQKLYYYWPA